MKSPTFWLIILTVISVLLPAQVSATTGVLEINSDTTLDEDHTGGVVLSSDNVILDCNGHSILGGGTVGIDAEGRSGVAIRNCTVQGFSIGIRFRNTVRSTIENNLLLGNTNGVDVLFSRQNILASNNARNNGVAFYIYQSDRIRLTSNDSLLDGIGYYLDSSNNNIVNRNTAESDTNGYKITNSSNNLLADNIGENNNTHFVIQFSSNNTFGENSANGGYDGFSLFASHNNIMNENTAINNILVGYRLVVSSGNKIAGNTALKNGDGFSVEANSTGNEIILNWITSNDRGIHICKSVFKLNDLIPNTFRGSQQAFAVDRNC